MSYCRWSSDDFQSDVYAYESEQHDFVIHIAGRRPEFGEDVPRLPPFPRGGGEELGRWVEASVEVSKAQTAWFEKYALAPEKWIDLDDIAPELAGRTFRERTLEEFRDRLLEVRAAGLHVPSDVFLVIAEEMKSDQSGGSRR